MYIDIIIPVYKNPQLTNDCIQSILMYLDDITAYDPRLIIINDSPDDEPTNEMLNALDIDRGRHLILSNKKNLGFVKTVNQGLKLSAERGCSALIVNSDTITYTNTISELIEVMNLDPQIGFVCPRSNNAAIATFPRPLHSLSGISVTPSVAYDAWQQASVHLPRFTFTPTAVGFYMLIAKNVVQNFGVLSEEFGLGYEEENDLVMRAGKVGYRAALANHAFAYHFGSASFMQMSDLNLEEGRRNNLMKLVNRHEEFLPLVRDYESSPDYRAEFLMKNFVKDSDGKLAVCFVLQSLGLHKNGTSEYIYEILNSLEKNPPNAFKIFVYCSKDVSLFHGIDKFKNIAVITESEPNFAIAILPGQPFDFNTVNLMQSMAPVNIYGMLDMIALDCSQIRAERGVEELWDYVANNSNGIFYISEFSAKTAYNRFRSIANKPSYISLLPNCFPSSQIGFAHGVKGLGRLHALVMGNHFQHKGSIELSKKLASQLPNLSVVALGAEFSTTGNLRTYQSGILGDEQMVDLFRDASVIVLPSYYEGFGISLVHAINLGKPVVVRDIPPTREILSSYENVYGVFLFERDSDLPEVVCNAIKSGNSGASITPNVPVRDWYYWTRGLIAFLESVLQRDDLYETLVSRIKAGDLIQCKRENMWTVAAPNNGVVRGGGSREASLVDTSSLLELPPSEFISAAFKSILKRPATLHDVNHHISLIDSGVSKRDILIAIARSDEVRTRSIHVFFKDPDLLTKKRKRNFCGFGSIMGKISAKKRALRVFLGHSGSGPHKVK